MFIRERTTIEASWKRSIACGVNAGTCLSDGRWIESIDPQSRISAASAPVLERMAHALEETRFAVALGDARGAVVDIRAGRIAIRDQIHSAGLVEGRLMTEEATGTNGIGTAIELGQGVKIEGADHFAEPLRGFHCYGHPIWHPLTKKLAGVLDVTCTPKDDSPLLPPFAMSAAREIEQRLLASSPLSQRVLFDAFERVSSQHTDGAVVGCSGDLFLSNQHAAALLSPVDIAALQALAQTLGRRDAITTTVMLSSGGRARIDARQHGRGAVMVLSRLPEPTSSPAPRPGSFEEPATGRITLICGEPGSGRTTKARRLAGDTATRLDGADSDEPEWLDSAAPLLVRPHTTIIIEDVHLLTDRTVRRLVALLARTHRAADVILTAGPRDGLVAEHQRLMSGAEIIELVPLRMRRTDIPSLATEIASRHGQNVAVEAARMLSRQDWPCNLAELEQVIADAATRCRGGEITVDDLPEHYRRSTIRQSMTTIEQARYDAIKSALQEAGGNKQAAADRLGISRTTLYRAIRHYALGELTS